MQELELHPLINPDANYYNEPGKRAAIEDFEHDYTVGQLMDWALITNAKYTHPGRKGKGEEEKDAVKAKTYSDYYKSLCDIADKADYIKEMTAAKAYEVLGIKYRYQ